jgi:hypothetical protein
MLPGLDLLRMYVLSSKARQYMLTSRSALLHASSLTPSLITIAGMYS